MNCSGDVNPVDGLVTMWWDAGLSVMQPDGCPGPGESVSVADAVAWGDTDCSGELTPVDALKIQRHDAGFSVVQPAGCPQPGEPVTVTVS